MKTQGVCESERELASYYDTTDVLDELVGDPVEVDLDEDLRTAILSGRRHLETRAVTIQMDPYEIQALRRIATLKSIPYQALVRHWIAGHIRDELRDAPA